MHERFNKTSEHIAPQPLEAEGVSNIERTHEVIVDLHTQYGTVSRSLEEGQALRVEAEERMLNLETPRTLTEIKRDNAHLIGSNLEALRFQKMAEARRRERDFDGGEYEVAPMQDAA